MAYLPTCPALNLPYGRLFANRVLLARTTIETLGEPRALLLFSTVLISARCSVVEPLVFCCFIIHGRNPKPSLRGARDLFQGEFSFVTTLHSV